MILLDRYRTEKNGHVFSEFIEKELNNLGRIHQREFVFVDVLRGLTVLGMILFHFIYDLSIFGLLPRNVYMEPGIVALRNVVLFGFTFLFGLSVAISASGKLFWKPYLFRTVRLAGSAVMVSVATYIAFPEQWVYFGIFHCLVWASIVVVPFIGRPYAALIVGVGLIFLSGQYNLEYHFVKSTRLFFDIWHQPFELITPFPWLGFTFLGITAFHFRFHCLFKSFFRPDFGGHWLSASLMYLGQHSLLVYFLHLPVLFGIVFLLSKLVG